MNWTSKKIEQLCDAFEHETIGKLEPMTVLLIEEYGRDPYLILISCLLSLRARDTMTYPVSKKLFMYARTPQEMVKISFDLLETILKPIGFFKRKAQILKEVSHELLNRFDGKVPNTEQELLSIKHVGRKTANLLLGVAFRVPALCVDTHVHRIANHLGLVSTKNPDQSEQALKKIVPKNLWIRLNYAFVKWGQHICTPYKNKCCCWEMLAKYGLYKTD